MEQSRHHDLSLFASCDTFHESFDARLRFVEMAKFVQMLSLPAKGVLDGFVERLEGA